MAQHKLYEQSVFAMAHTDLSVHPLNNHGRTIRLLVDANTDAVALKFKFSNEYGTSPVHVGTITIAKCDENAVPDASTFTPVTVGGKLSFFIPAEEKLLSDQIDFEIAPGELFSVSIYYPDDERLISGNWIGTVVQRSANGNFTVDNEIPGLSLASRLNRAVMHTDMTTAITSLCEIIAYRKSPGKVFACFGDSITQQGNWSVPFTKRLYMAYPGKISLCNLAISGNRLFHDSPEHLGKLNGKAGISRFADNMLSLHGLTHALLELGSNDIGLPDGKNVPLNELVKPEEYIATIESLAQQLKDKNVKVFVATISPRVMDSKPFNASREVTRLLCNEKIRKSEVFDAVLDFDAALRRDDGEPGMPDEFSLIDGLHPSVLGGLQIARAIDLSLFGED